MTDGDLKQLIIESARETRQHFDTVGEGLRQQVQIVAEGVSSNGERLDRLAVRVDRVESSMQREFEEMRSMIRLSYTELDRRLRTLEDTVSSLQSRMERLEQSAQ